MSGINIQVTGEYPRLWKKGLIQKRVRARANHRCEECGMEFQQGTNLALSVKRQNGQPFVGTVHHIDGNKSNCCMRNLVFLCQRCHWTLHLEGWTPGRPCPRRWRNGPPKWVTDRGLDYQWIQQMELFEELQS